MIYDKTTHVSKGCYIRDAVTRERLRFICSADDETGELVQDVVGVDGRCLFTTTRICAWEIVTKDTGEVIARYPPRD